MSDLAALVGALPAGSHELGCSLVAGASRRLQAVAGERFDLDGDAVAELLVLPRLLDPSWPAPTPPTPVAAGAVHSDVVDDDRDVLAALLASSPGADAEQVATTAQAWRLPVTPYRAPSPGRWRDVAPPPAAERGARRAGGLAGLTVVDLTALWAGPLCTSLLAAAGARVVKVDPSCRPDGFRERPALYQRLNGGKEVVDLDLRCDDDRGRFEDLVRGADLVVHSFSRRVLPNLGYAPARLAALNPQVATLAIAAFPAGSPEAGWLAYGTGVHAASGLGLVEGEPVPAPIAYPDPLAGLAALDVALALLGRHGPGRHAEVSLAGAIAPLVPVPVPA